VRLLVQAATGVLPGEERWNAIWDEIGFKVDRDDAGRPVIRVEWPGVPNEPRTYGGKKISLDLDDADLKEVLRTLVDASGGLNLVADSGIHGTVTLKVREMPWAQALDLVLASNGLVARGQGNVLTVAPPERLPTMVRSGVPGGGRRYTGEPLSLEFRDTDLMDVFRFFADATHMNIVVHPGISGKVTAQMRQVPWDRALDLVLRTNDLAANHVGDLVEIGRPDRLGTRTHFEGKPIDIDFVRVDLVESLVRIADNGGRTVAYPPGIAGKVTLKLTQVPWDQAFDVLVRLNGLAWKEEGTNIRVDRAVKP
jgi:type II secretory pathway component HofQ